MFYGESRDWMISPKQYLGAAFLAAGKWTEAQKTFEKDLKVNAENVWSLYGLEQSLVKQKKQNDAVGYTIYYGIAPDKLYNNIMVYGDNSYDFRGLDKGTTYYFTIEAFNENGIGKKNKIIVVK